jgi:alpha-galactosidase
MKTSKIVFIGAGSMSFGLSTYRNLFSTQELAGSTLCLVDIDRENLKRMAALARKMNSQCGTSYKIEATTDRREALPGAEFVINSLAVERNRLWKLDFEIPKKYGIRHTLGENGGPGGLFFTFTYYSLDPGHRPRHGRTVPGCLFLKLLEPGEPYHPGDG